MAFIKVQKLQYDEDGVITSGSAAIVETQYVPGSKYHAKHTVRERLGKVLWLAPDKKSGIFQSPTRGLTAYDAISDTFQDISPDDPRLAGRHLSPAKPVVHVVFGDVYLILSQMENTGFAQILQQAFPKPGLRHRLLCHLLHDLARDGGRISCDNFHRQSAASLLFPDVPADTLKQDAVLFNALGTEASKAAFFQAHLTHRLQGRELSGVYVDTLDLPYDPLDSPFEDLYSSDSPGDSPKSRLALIVDSETGLPLWLDLVPESNCSYKKLSDYMQRLTKRLPIPISQYILGRRYVGPEWWDADQDFLARMPDSSRFPYQSLFRTFSPLFRDTLYQFTRDRRLYFGGSTRLAKWGPNLYAYVYVDHGKAREALTQSIRDWGINLEELDPEERAWQEYQGGYFVLVSNRDEDPEIVLDRYCKATALERSLKRGEDWLDVLPFPQWTEQTIQGKFLYDSILAIALHMLQQSLPESLSELLGKASSVMCAQAASGRITVETPNSQAKAALASVGISLPANLDPVSLAQRF